MPGTNRLSRATLQAGYNDEYEGECPCPCEGYWAWKKLFGLDAVYPVTIDIQRTFYKQFQIFLILGTERHQRLWGGSLRAGLLRC